MESEFEQDRRPFWEVPDYTWAEFREEFDAECLQQWENGLRSPEAITLPEQVFPGISAVVNQVTGADVPVRRVPMFSEGKPYSGHTPGVVNMPADMWDALTGPVAAALRAWRPLPFEAFLSLEPEGHCYTTESGLWVHMRPACRHRRGGSR